jgi:hypothetical protein
MVLVNPILFPMDYHASAKSLIRHLTMHDLSKRFGNLIGGAQDVKQHRYFKSIDFDRIKNMVDVKAPYVPQPGKITLEFLE